MDASGLRWHSTRARLAFKTHRHFESFDYVPSRVASSNCALTSAITPFGADTSDLLAGGGVTYSNAANQMVKIRREASKCSKCVAGVFRRERREIP